MFRKIVDKIKQIPNYKIVLALAFMAVTVPIVACMAVAGAFGFFGKEVLIGWSGFTVFLFCFAGYCSIGP